MYDGYCQCILCWIWTKCVNSLSIIYFIDLKLEIISVYLSSIALPPIQFLPVGYHNFFFFWISDMAPPE